MVDRAEQVLEAERQQFEAEARRIAAGGWQRALIGFGVGAAAGVLAALLIPRDEGASRTVLPGDRPRPFER